MPGTTSIALPSFSHDQHPVLGEIILRMISNQHQSISDNLILKSKWKIIFKSTKNDFNSKSFQRWFQIIKIITIRNVI